MFLKIFSSTLSAKAKQSEVIRVGMISLLNFEIFLIGDIATHHLTSIIRAVVVLTVCAVLVQQILNYFLPVGRSFKCHQNEFNVAFKLS